MNFSTLETQVGAQRALLTYRSLPDGETIARHTTPANSPKRAVELIQEAQNEAWRIREEMAKSWSPAVLDLVIREVRSSEGTKGKAMTDDLHPIVGPLLKAKYPEGIDAHQREFVVKAWEEEKALRREAAKKAASPSRKINARETEKKKEFQRMKKCIEAYGSWLKGEKRQHGRDSIAAFPKQPNITLKRSGELISTLDSASRQPSVKTDLAELLRNAGFAHADATVAGDCLDLFKKTVTG